MNLVVGATGILGGEICRRLVAKDKPVRALVRPTADQAKLASLEQLGAEFVSGDLKDRASLEVACRGVTTIISTATTTISRQEGDTIESVDLAGQINLIDAARAAGVPRFMYVSYSGNIDREDPCPLTIAKRTVEQHLQRSGLAYTILRPTFFMEVWLGPALGFDAANASAQIYGEGLGKISWIAVGDVAQFAVEALDNPVARNTIVELGGPEALSPLEVVQIFEQFGGRPFGVQHVPEEAIRAQKAAATDSLAQSFAALMLNYAKGDEIDMRDTLRTYPVPLISVRDYAARVLAQPAQV
jgi:uncharacterized protein YbjT (DUF2867 family)